MSGRISWSDSPEGCLGSAFLPLFWLALVLSVFTRRARARVGGAS